jgi:hypothetical protein
MGVLESQVRDNRHEIISFMICNMLKSSQYRHGGPNPILLLDATGKRSPSGIFSKKPENPKSHFQIGSPE